MISRNPEKFYRFYPNLEKYEGIITYDLNILNEYRKSIENEFSSIKISFSEHFNGRKSNSSFVISRFEWESLNAVFTGDFSLKTPIDDIILWEVRGYEVIDCFHSRDYSPGSSSLGSIINQDVRSSIEHHAWNFIRRNSDQIVKSAKNFLLARIRLEIMSLKEQYSIDIADIIEILNEEVSLNVISS